MDELQQIAELNSASIICITESWLSPDIHDRCVSIPGFNLFRRDRIGSSGGGVCVYLDHEIRGVARAGAGGPAPPPLAKFGAP
jgi:hypothetical protein